MGPDLDVVPAHIPELETFHWDNLYSIVYGKLYRQGHPQRAQRGAGRSPPRQRPGLLGHPPFTNLYLRNDAASIWSLLSTPSLYSFLNTSRTSDGIVVPDIATLQSAASNFTNFRSLPANYTNLTAVVVRTMSLNVSDELTEFIGGQPSPWALITVDGFEIMEPPMQDTQA